MRRIRIAALLSAVVIGLLAAPAAAVPTNSPKQFEVELECDGDDGPDAVLGLENSSVTAWGLDEAGDLNGSHYVTRRLEFRGYLGYYDVEPGNPLFTDIKEWGKRTGRGPDIECSFVLHFSDPEEVTLFGDGVLAMIK